MTANHTDDPCPYCGGTPTLTITVTKSTVPVEAVAFCCEMAQARWAEHYDGEILRMPPIELKDES